MPLLPPEEQMSVPSASLSSRLCFAHPIGFSTMDRGMGCCVGWKDWDPGEVMVIKGPVHFSCKGEVEFPKGEPGSDPGRGGTGFSAETNWSLPESEQQEGHSGEV